MTRTLPRFLLPLAAAGFIALIALASSPAGAQDATVAHHRADFEYLTTLRQSALDPLGAEVTASASEPGPQDSSSILLSLAQSVDVTAKYELVGDYTNVSGTLVAELKVSAVDGWERTWPLGSTTAITGHLATGQATLDLPELAEKLETIAADTEYHTGNYEVTVLFTAHVTATAVDGTLIDDIFVAPFAMPWNSTRVMMPTNLRAESKAIAETVGAEVPTRSLFGLPLIPESTSGRVSYALTLLLIIGAGVAWFRFRSGPRLTRMRVAADVVRASIATDPGQTRQIHCTTLDALARAAKVSMLPLCFDERRNIYFALDRDVMYLWRDEPGLRPVDTRPASAA